MQNDEVIWLNRRLTSDLLGPQERNTGQMVLAASNTMNEILGESSTFNYVCVSFTFFWWETLTTYVKKTVYNKQPCSCNNDDTHWAWAENKWQSGVYGTTHITGQLGNALVIHSSSPSGKENEEMPLINVIISSLNNVQFESVSISIERTILAKSARRLYGTRWIKEEGLIQPDLKINCVLFVASCAPYTSGKMLKELTGKKAKRKYTIYKNGKWNIGEMSMWNQQQYHQQQQHPTTKTKSDSGRNMDKIYSKQKQTKKKQSTN